MRMMVADMINGTTLVGTSDLIETENSGTGVFMYIAIEPFYGININETISYKIHSKKTLTSNYFIPFFKYPENIKCVDAADTGNELVHTGFEIMSYNFSNCNGMVVYTGTSKDTMKIEKLYDFGTSMNTIGTYGIFMTYDYTVSYYDISYSYGVINNCYLLPEQSGYNPYFTEEKVKHKLDNGKTLTYFKGFNFNADINFEQISGTELSNLKEIKNLKTNLRFFPNIAEKPNLSYDVIWDNDFNYPFTVPTYTGGGYNGNIHFEGITRLGSIGDTI